jgi:hypothetical protein
VRLQTVAAILLLVIGGLALAYGGFTYTRATHRADLGPLHMAVDDRQQVNVPVWAGVGALLLGGVLLLTGTRR